MDDDPLQRRIYFFTFIKSLETTFSQYKETYEVLLDYPQIGGENIKYSVKKAIRNVLHTNIDVHSRRLIYEFPGDGVKGIVKLQSHCANMTFSEKSRYDRTFQKVTHKEGESAMNYIKIFQNSQSVSVSVRISTQRINKRTYFWITFTKMKNILLKYLATRQS